MIDTLHLGSVSCQFLPLKEFEEQCQTWLATNTLHHVVTLNPEMVLRAEHDPEFRAAVEAADIRVPDGAGLIWARWFIRSQFWSLLPSLIAFPFIAAERITGVDTVRLLARLCSEQKRGLYLLGGTPEQVTRTAKRLRQEFPSLNVQTSPPHRRDLAGPPEIVAEINHQAPAVLLVAYGAPAQTLWIERQRSELPSVRIAVGVGGAFGILSEDRPRAPLFIRRLNMEWLWRLLLEPTRLPRIWQATVRFPWLIRQQKKHLPPPLFS
jgi:N-acetylglucosaminyldiphosphoundecaprenol N-acetyl-beta-D-mannosaminyltransferase